MGNLITWIIGVPIIAIAIYILVKSIKGKASGGGCGGCSGGCSSEDKSSCH